MRHKPRLIFIDVLGKVMIIEGLRALLKNDLQALNLFITARMQSNIGLIDELTHHIIHSGGKRLRPLLVMLSARACGYQGEAHIALAAMIEFFHTATLLHDDVVDSSTLRRGQETANEIWGSKASILVGDYLFTQSVKIMVGVNHNKILNLLADVSHKISCGEVKQLANRHNFTLSIQEYMEIIQAKTALLFAASATIGAILSDSHSLVEQNLYDYGLHLGNAFQLIDDALDYCSDAETIGKNIGDDLADGKATLPLLHAMQFGTEEQRNIIQQSLENGGLDNLLEIKKAIESTKSIAYTRNCAESEVSKALAALDNVPDSSYKSALIELAEFALKREF